MRTWQKSKLLWGVACAFALILLCFGWMFYEGYQTEAIIKDLQGRGFKVDYTTDSPDWLRELGGPVDTAVKKIVSFRNVVKLKKTSHGKSSSDQHQEFTPEDVQKLRQLTELKYLYLNPLIITNEGLVHIGELSKLEILQTNCSDVTDTGFRHICLLSNLSHLRLEGELKVTSKGFAGLVPLLRLTRLLIPDTPVTDEGLAQICQLNRLESVELNGSLLTMKGILQLEQAPNLRDVAIFNPILSEREMEELVHNPIGGRILVAFYHKDPVTKNYSPLKEPWTDNH